MDTFAITTITAMSEEERAEWARAFAFDDPLTIEHISSMLEATRNGIPVEKPGELVAIVVNDQLDGEIREHALLTLYYHVAAAKETEAENEEAIGAIETLIHRLSGIPKREPDERVRGRKYWVHLRGMIENKTPTEIVADTVQRFCREETSPFALDRIAFAIKSDLSTVFSLFPLDGTWSLPETDEWNRIERRAIQDTASAGAVLGTLRRRMPALLSGAAHGENSLRRYVESLSSSEREYVVSPSVVSETLITLSPIERNRVLAVCTGAATRDDTQRLSDYLTALITLSEGERDWADQFSILGLQATIANVGSDTMPLDYLVGPALQLLTTPIPEPYDCSATRHKLAKVVGGILRVVFTDPDTTRNALAQDAAGDLDLIESLTAALEMDSPYRVNVAADVALLLSRNRVLAEELVEPLIDRLARSPQTDGGLCSGHDFSDDDIVIPDGVEIIYLSSLDEETKESDTDGGDQFFSVSGLTGMLEGCREPYCAWRIAAALTGYADMKRDAELTTRLLSYAEVNEVIDEWEPTVNRAAAELPPGTAPSSTAPSSSNTPQQPKEKVHPDQPGPFILTEIVSTMQRIFDVPEEQWPDIQPEIAQDHERTIQQLVSHSQRSRVREVFEGVPGGGKTDLWPLVPIATQILQRGFTSFVPLPSFVPGTLDDQSDYGQTELLDPIASTEVLAYYVARECLPSARSHQWGIYFRVRPFSALNRALPGSLPALVESVAVHELMHHHTAIRTKELGIKRVCGTFRVLEEATADWNGVQRLTQLLNDGTITAERFREIMRMVFPRRDEGGMPGYGDWPLMDSDAAPLAPYFDSAAWNTPKPDGYRAGKQLLCTASKPEAITPIQLPREHRLWASVLDAIGTGEIPMYLDFQ